MNIRIIFSFFLYLVIWPLFQACDHEPAAIPSYVRIDTIPLDSTSFDSTGATSHQIRFAWVYIDDNLQGVYKLPALFPVLDEGEVNFKIFAGVNENGISTSATRYFFYAPYDTIEKLAIGDTTLLRPRVRYQKGLEVPYMQDFNSTLSAPFEKVSGSGFFNISVTPGIAQEGAGAGLMYLPPGGENLVIESQTINIPTGKPGYYIELDYRNNCNFLLGVRSAASSQGGTFLGVRPREQWNKIYINVTQIIDQLSAQGTNYRIFFVLPQDTTVSEQTVLIDNLKLLY